LVSTVSDEGVRFPCHGTVVRGWGVFPCRSPGVGLTSPGLVLDGTWQPITVFAAVYGFLPATFLQWVFDPTDWVSLAKALQQFLFWSLWWVLMLLSIAILYGALAIDKLSHRRQLRYHRMRQNEALESESQGWLSARTD